MKVVPDCWDDLTVSECQYGAYIFRGDEFSIYVSSWLDATPELCAFFSKKNNSGFVGHCVLKFGGVRSVQINVATYSIESNGKTKWNPSTSTDLLGGGEGGAAYCLSGSLRGFLSSIDIAIDAASFELHILGSGEPVGE